MLTRRVIKWYTIKAVDESCDKAITKPRGQRKKLKKLSKKYLTNEKQPDIIVRLSRKEYGFERKLARKRQAQILENRTTELRKKKRLFK